MFLSSSQSADLMPCTYGISEVILPHQPNRLPSDMPDVNKLILFGGIVSLIASRKSQILPYNKGYGVTHVTGIYHGIRHDATQGTTDIKRCSIVTVPFTEPTNVFVTDARVALSDIDWATETDSLPPHGTRASDVLAYTNATSHEAQKLARSVLDLGTYSICCVGFGSAEGENNGIVTIYDVATDAPQAFDLSQCD